MARSSAKAEFRPMTNGICELQWLKMLLAKLGFLMKGPMNLFCDNKAAISIAHDPVQHDWINMWRLIDMLPKTILSQVAYVFPLFRRSIKLQMCSPKV